MKEHWPITACHCGATAWKPGIDKDGTETVRIYPQRGSKSTFERARCRGRWCTNERRMPAAKVRSGTTFVMALEDGDRVFTVNGCMYIASPNAPLRRVTEEGKLETVDAIRG